MPADPPKASRTKCNPCELVNVLSACTAFLLSMIGTTMCINSRDAVRQAMSGVGAGVSTLGSIDASLSFNFAIIVILNMVAAIIVCLSTYECSIASALACMMSSGALCWWALLAFATFLVQLIMSQVVTVSAIIVSVFNLFCHLGDGVEVHAQELFYHIGNVSLPDDLRPPQYGVPHLNVTDTPIISFEQIVQNVNVEQFCLVVPLGIQSSIIQLWVGILLTVVSQAIMSMALTGEKERVHVHEIHEREENESDGEYARDVRFSSEEESPMSPIRSGSGLSAQRFRQADNAAPLRH